MSEPVKVVIVIQGGVVSTVLSCGVPVRAVIIDYDADDDDAMALPEADGTETMGVAWEILVEDENPEHALKLFNAGGEAHGLSLQHMTGGVD